MLLIITNKAHRRLVRFDCKICLSHLFAIEVVLFINWIHQVYWNDLLFQAQQCQYGDKVQWWYALLHSTLEHFYAVNHNQQLFRWCYYYAMLNMFYYYSLLKKVFNPLVFRVIVARFLGMLSIDGGSHIGWHFVRQVFSN